MHNIPLKKKTLKNLSKLEEMKWAEMSLFSMTLSNATVFQNLSAI